MLPVTFGIHKTFLVASTLAARLGPKPVYRNAKCRGGAESSAQAKPSADVPWCREGAHAKRPNSSRIRAHAKQNAPMRSFRKPRTAASFVPKACKTQASKNAKNTSQKKCFPSPLESIKHFFVASTLADSSPRQAKCPYAKLPKASNGSKLRAQGMQNTSQKKGSQKRCVRNPSTWCRIHCWQRIRKGQTPLYKPSSGKPKTMRSQPFHTVPKLQLRSRKKKHR